MGEIPTLWSQKEWNGYNQIIGHLVWTDGEHIYYSNNQSQYVLDKDTNTWSAKTWNGFTPITGSYIWTDGDDIYYSNGSSTQYVLDTSTSTWTSMTWSGYSGLVGTNVWTDGTDIYYSDLYGRNMKLTKATHTWSSVSWSVIINGYFIWTDGENTYYSNGDQQKVFDKANNTWNAMTWNIAPSGSYIWTDGKNIYYSNSTDHYILNTSTLEWSPKTWQGINDFNGDDIWTDGIDYYYSNVFPPDSVQYVLNIKRNVNKILFGNNTQVDLTSDTVTANDMHLGCYCHNAAGEVIQGTFDFATATSGTATSADLPSGKSLWVNGQLVEGEFEVPTFADGTDEEIAMALQKHYAGEIDLTDYWTVGDKRTIHINAMEATGVSESHHADDYEFVIIGMNHDDLTTPINGVTKAAITVQLDRILYTDTTSATYSSSDEDAAHEFGYMNSTVTNVGGWTSCARRTWCNNVFFGALPVTIQSTIKNVDKKTSAGNQSSTINTDSDKVFLPSEIEIFGTIAQSESGEGSQYPYFTTTSNIYKKPIYTGYQSARWWERSPHGSNASNFCLVNIDGTADGHSAINTYGLAPAFCL